MGLRGQSKGLIVNGSFFSWGSVTVDIAGLQIPAKSISYWSEMTGGRVTSIRTNIIGRTPGKKKDGGEIALYKRDAYEFLEKLGDNFGTKRFDIWVTYAEPEYIFQGANTVEIPTAAYSDRILNTRISKVGDEGDEGGDPTLMRFTLDPTDIEWDGRSMFKQDVLKGAE